jgi:dipeptidyl aminopeptidase/acylaminoacyl peptidase
MKRRCLLFALCALWISGGWTAQAQISIRAPGFDPSPVEIKAVRSTASRAITNMDLLLLRDFRGLKISPDGNSVAYVVSEAVYETNSYRTGLFVVGTASGSIPINLGSAGWPGWDTGQMRPFDITWSPDSREIILLAKLDESGWQLWRWPREGGPPTRLTHASHDVVDYHWSNDQSQIFLTVAESRRPEEVKKLLEKGIAYDGSVAAWSINPTFSDAVTDVVTAKEVRVYDLQKQSERKATLEEIQRFKEITTPPEAGDGYIAYYPPAVGPDGKSLAFVAGRSEPAKSGYVTSLFIKRPDDSKPLRIFEAPIGGYIFGWNLRWSKDGDEIYFVQQNAAADVGLYVASVKNGAIRQINKGEDFLFEYSIDQDYLRAACILQNKTTPSELAIMDLKSGVARSLVKINPEFHNIALSTPTKLEVTNKYGDKSTSYLIKPPNYVAGKRYPLIVTTYFSSAFLRGAAGDEYPIQVFAANGFVVLDFTAPPQRGVQNGDFKTQTLRWYAPIDSLATALKMLDEMGIVDSNRRGLSGLSYGADITNFMISHTDLFQAAINSGGGGWDPAIYYLGADNIRQLLTQWGLAGLREEETAHRWREISASLNASRITAPLLINTADSELVISAFLYQRLKDLKRPVEMFVYANEQHTKNQPKHRLEIYQRNLDWFNFWLQDKEDRDPNKAKQYERWRAMRRRGEPAMSALP